MLKWFARLLGLTRGVRVVPRPLEAQACSPEAADREAAAGLLSPIPELWAGELLLSLLRDPHPDVRGAARDGLRARGVLAAPELLAGLNGPDVEVAGIAADLLGGLGAPELAPPLLVALKFGTRPVQVSAGRALARLGRVAVPALEAAAAEPDYWVRHRIAEILADIRRTSPPSVPANPGDPGQPAPPTAEKTVPEGESRPEDRATESRP
jgi:HEAT repeat protein